MVSRSASADGDSFTVSRAAAAGPALGRLHLVRQDHEKELAARAAVGRSQPRMPQDDPASPAELAQVLLAAVGQEPYPPGRAQGGREQWLPVPGMVLQPDSLGQRTGGQIGDRRRSRASW